MDRRLGGARGVGVARSVARCSGVYRRWKLSELVRSRACSPARDRQALGKLVMMRRWDTLMCVPTVLAGV